MLKEVVKWFYGNLRDEFRSTNLKRFSLGFVLVFIWLVVIVSGFYYNNLVLIILGLLPLFVRIRER
jgi:hypothetical protein